MKQVLKDFLANTDETGRFTVTSQRTGIKYFVEPISLNLKITYNRFNISVFGNSLNSSGCSLKKITFVPVDIDALIQGDPMTLSAATEIDLGTITACGNIADFLKVEVADLGLDTTLLSGVSFINGNSFTEINAGNGIDSSTQIDFHLYWQDNTPNIVKPGTYNVFPNETHLQLLITPVQYLYLTAASASAGTVTVTQGGSQPGDVITGTYEYIGTEAGTTITHQVSGSFRQTLQ